MFTIFKRDFLAYFRTPVGYVFMGVFLTLSGLIFYLYNLQNLSGDLLTFLSQLTLLVMLLSPLLTMRLICEDRQKRTDQLIFTSGGPGERGAGQVPGRRLHHADHGAFDQRV